MVTFFKIFSHRIMNLCSVFSFFFSIRFSKVQQICRLTMLYFQAYFHSFVDYSPFALKAEFIAFLSTVTTSFVLWILFPARRIRMTAEQQTLTELGWTETVTPPITTFFQLKVHALGRVSHKNHISRKTVTL